MKPTTDHKITLSQAEEIQNYTYGDVSEAEKQVNDVKECIDTRSYHRGIESVGAIQGQLNMPLRGLNTSSTKGICLNMSGSA